MAGTRVARRYARALFKVTDLKVHAEHRDQLAQMKGLYASRDVRRFLANPVMPIEAKHAVLDRILEKIGADPDFKSYFHLLADNGRLDCVPQIADIYEELYNSELGILPARVTSARPLSDEVKQRLTDSLAKKFNAQVKLESRTDPALLGGMIIDLHNKVIDLSLRNQIETLTSSLNINGR